MKTTKTNLPGVLLLVPDVYRDERGFFLETYHRELYAASGIDAEFVQDNQSGSRAGVLRGLHYQIQNSQGKLVRAVVGEVFDVAVDLRRSSETFGEWFGTSITAKGQEQMWVPPGFAHGFYVLSDWAEISYKVTDYYSPKWERTLRWDDPKVAIEWPLLLQKPPIISNKDANGLFLDEAPHFD